jgi:hypothetical protein
MSSREPPFSRGRGVVPREVARDRVPPSTVAAAREQSRQCASRCQLLAVAPIGFATTGTGAVIALFVMAMQTLTGATAFVAHDSLVMLSAVLIETGVVLIGLGLFADAQARMAGDSARSR